MIAVLNKHKHDVSQAIYIGRGTALGNPFRLKSAGGDYERGETLTHYRAWLLERIEAGDKSVMKLLNYIYMRWQAESYVELACYCAPLGCHGDVVREILSERRVQQMATQALDTPAFRSTLQFCSNTYYSSVFRYPSVEHAFVAAKTTDPRIRAEVLRITSPHEVKAFGKKIKLRPDWADIKHDVMETLVREKFTRHDHLGHLLRLTGTIELVERNDWKDVHWGVCKGYGENYLGRILMQVRSELSHSATKLR